MAVIGITLAMPHAGKRAMTENRARQLAGIYARHGASVKAASVISGPNTGCIVVVRGYADFRAALAADERSLDDYLTGLAGIDLDGCRNPETGSLTPEAQASVAAFPDWFWEVSPSGTGLHGMGFSDLVLDRGKKRGWVGSYNTGRFFTVTAD